MYTVELHALALHQGLHPPAPHGEKKFLQTHAI